MIRRDALDRLDDLLGAVGQHRLDQEVDVIPVRPDLQEGDLVAVPDVKAGATQGRLHLAADDRAAVLGRADRVVEQRGDVVALVDVLAHAPASYQIRGRQTRWRNKLRGMTPAEIQGISREWGCAGVLAGPGRCCRWARVGAVRST